jgi:hypothetical protein
MSSVKQKSKGEEVEVPQHRYLPWVEKGESMTNPGLKEKVKGFVFISA